MDEMTGNELRHILGQNVKNRRKELRITQAALGGTLGCTPQRISQLEAGYNSLPVDLLAKLATALRCTPAALVTEGSFAAGVIHA